MFFSNIKIAKETKGFTLIEVLVSMSLFTVVVTMSVGTLLVLIDANSKAQSMQLVMTNVSFALDSMTREIRTGYQYECKSLHSSLTETDVATFVTAPDCSGGQSNFAFTESGDSLTAGHGSNRIAYRFADDGNGNGSIERRLGTDSGADEWQAITAPEVDIETLDFVVTDARPFSDNGDIQSPLVTIYISGTAGDIAGLDTTFSLQTTVTQESLDL